MKEQTINISILIVCIATFTRIIDAQVCGSYGFFCDTCSTVQVCSSGVSIGISLNCPDGTYCDQTSEEVCTSTTCTSEPYPFYECENTGKFAWVYNCSQYIWCLNDTGTLYPTLNSCPSTTVFNPNTKACVLATSYTCVDETTTESVTESTTVTDAESSTTEAGTTTTEATTVDSTTAVDTTITEASTTTEPATTTTEAVSTTTTEATTTTTEASTTTEAATTTITTTEATTTTTTEAATTTIEPTTTTTEATTTTTEAATTTIEPTTTTTEATTTTTEAETTTVTTTSTTTSATTTTTPATFVCTAYGRFAITSDTTCQSYYFCYPNTDGTFTRETFICPTTTVFNPTTAKCVLPTAYTCTN